MFSLPLDLVCRGEAGGGDCHFTNITATVVFIVKELMIHPLNNATSSGQIGGYTTVSSHQKGLRQAAVAA